MKVSPRIAVVGPGNARLPLEVALAAEFDTIERRTL